MKTPSGKFVLTMMAGIGLLAFVFTLCCILWNNPTVDLSDPIVFLLGAVTGWIGTIINNYFRKKEDL